MERIPAVITPALVVFLVAFVAGVSGAAGKDDGMVREYPDGGLGIEIGEGYETEPDGDFQPAAPYREDYRDTPYGPAVGRGYVDFPSTMNYGKPDKKKTEDETERRESMKGYLFQEATTSTEGSTFWGVSGPPGASVPKRQKSPEEPEEKPSGTDTRKKAFYYEHRE